MPEDDERIAAWRSLLLAQSRVLRTIEADLAKKGLLPLRWYDVLLELNGAPGRRLRMQELAGRVVLSRTRVSRVVDELVRAGLVQRVADPDDGRAAFAVLTKSGRDELRRTAPAYLAGIEAHFTGLLADEERAVLAQALGRVADHHADRTA